MFYTYVWLREDGTPYYVGKGKVNRAYVDHWISGRVRRVPPKERIVVHPASSESEAIENEVALIWYYGRKDLGTGCLRNFTSGGEGAAGCLVSKETRLKRSALLKGKPWSEAKRKSNIRQPRTTPTCHPNRKHKAHGLCKACAYRAWIKKNGPRKK